MRRPLLMLTLCLIAGCSGMAAPDRADADAAAAPATLTDLADKPHQPLSVEPGEVSVLVFSSTDCPIANAYAPEINRMVAAAPPGVRFYLVHVDPDLQWAEARLHAANYGYECPVLIDRDHALVRATGVTVTPEAAVLAHDPNAPQRFRVVYTGRISNLYEDYGVKRAFATTHELRDAIAAAQSGRPVRNPRVPAIGCVIPR